MVASATSKSSSSASSASSTASSASSTVLSQQAPPQPAAQLHSKQQHQLYQQQQQQKQLHNNSGASSSTNSSTNNSLNGTSLYYNTPGQANGNGNGNNNTSNYHLFALSSQHNQPYDTSTIGTALGNFISNGGGGDQNPYNGNMNSLTKQFGHTMNLNGSATTTHNNMMMMMLNGADDSAFSDLGRDELNVLMNEAVVRFVFHFF